MTDDITPEWLDDLRERLHHPIHRRMLMKVGPPPRCAGERPLPAITNPSASRALKGNFFPIALPQSNSGATVDRTKQDTQVERLQ